MLAKRVAANKTSIEPTVSAIWSARKYYGDR
jgi:hypothetical protein